MTGGAAHPGLNVPADLHASFAGSYSSADLSTPAVPNPPTSKSRPSGSSTEPACSRAAAIAAAEDHVPLLGSWISAEASGSPVAPTPPATRTRPSVSLVAEAHSRAVCTAPVASLCP